MKKQIIIGITVAACVALCATVWLRDAEVGNLPAMPVKATVSTEIEAQSEEIPHILLSADSPAPEVKEVVESEPPITEITAEKESLKPAQAQTEQPVKPTASSSEPHNGDVRVVDGERQIYLLGFGWIKDKGGGDAPPANNSPVPGTKKYIDGVLHIWVPDFGYVPYSGTNVGTVAEDMYESGVKIGIMGGDECPSSKTTPPPLEQPEPTGDVIYAPIQPPVTKDSSPPTYKPNGEPYNP